MCQREFGVTTLRNEYGHIASTEIGSLMNPLADGHPPILHDTIRNQSLFALYCAVICLRRSWTWGVLLSATSWARRGVIDTVVDIPASADGPL